MHNAAARVGDQRVKSFRRCTTPDLAGAKPQLDFGPHRLIRMTRAFLVPVRHRFIGNAVLRTPGPKRMKLLKEVGEGRVAAVEGLAVPPSLPETRSEEHTSELQSRQNLLCRL